MQLLWYSIGDNTGINPDRAFETTTLTLSLGANTGVLYDMVGNLLQAQVADGDQVTLGEQPVYLVINDVVDDSDNDGLPDAWEIDHGFNPYDAADAALDTDNDLLSNLDEYTSGTDPRDDDSDDDGMPDGWELANLFDPNTANGTDDPDSDGLNNADEYQYHTDPHNSDSDGDGISDGDEVAAGTNPLALSSSLTCSTPTMSLTPSETETISLLLTNTNRVADTFDLTISGIESGWYTLAESQVTLMAGEERVVELMLHMPADCGITPLAYTISAAAVSADTGPVANGGVDIDLQLQLAPEISDLIPEGGEQLSTNAVVFSWQTNVAATTELYYRWTGESGYNRAVGVDGTTHRILLDNLVWDRTYEWYVVSAGDCAEAQSDVRSFTILDGVVFGQRQYSFEILRDYDQRVTFDIVNRDVNAHDVIVSVMNPQGELIADFVDSASQDAVRRLEAGETHTVTLALHAQDAVPGQFPLTFRLTADPASSNPITDFASADVTVREPVFNLSFSETGSNPALRTNTYTITNSPDSQDVVTDLRVFAEEDSVAPMIVFQPRIEHYRLGPGESVVFNAVFQPTDGITQYTGNLILEGGGQRIPLNTHFGCPDGTNLYDVVLSNTNLCMRSHSWYCTNRKDISVNFDVPQGVAPENIQRARLYLNFTLTWPLNTYRPHDVTVQINGQTVETYLNTIPEGPYGIELPPELIRTGIDSAGRNTISLLTEHMNGGHYVVASDFQVILDVAEVAITSVCATSQTEADQTALNFPFLCSGEPAWNLCPIIQDIVPVDDTGDGRWDFNPGEQVQFRVTMASPDLDDHSCTLDLVLEGNATGDPVLQDSQAFTLPAGATASRVFFLDGRRSVQIYRCHCHVERFKRLLDQQGGEPHRLHQPAGGGDGAGQRNRCRDCQRKGVRIWFWGPMDWRTPTPIAPPPEQTAVLRYIYPKAITPSWPASKDFRRMSR